MGGRGVRDNVLQFSTGQRGRADEPRGARIFAAHLPSTDAPNLTPMPARRVDVHEAVSELKDVFGGMIDETVYVRLAFPSELLCSRFEGGVEFYDAHSRRPAVRTAGETIAEEASWVRSWYLSVFRSGGIWTARYIDRIHPDITEGRRLGEYEQVVRDAAKGIDDEGLKDFIRSVKMRV